MKQQYVFNLLNLVNFAPVKDPAKHSAQICFLRTEVKKTQLCNLAEHEKQMMREDRRDK